jgi:hypothetical protein
MTDSVRLPNNGSQRTALRLQLKRQDVGMAEGQENGG